MCKENNKIISESISPLITNWVTFPDFKPNYGDEILIYPPPEQQRTKEILVYDRYSNLIDGTDWVLITPNSLYLP